MAVSVDPEVGAAVAPAADVSVDASADPEAYAAVVPVADVSVAEGTIFLMHCWRAVASAADISVDAPVGGNGGGLAERTLLLIY